MDTLLPGKEAHAAKARARIGLTICAILTGLMLVGLFVDFVPADVFRGSPVWFLMFAAGLATAVWLIGRARQRGTWSAIPWFKRWLGAGVMPFALMGMFWLIVAKGVPWIYTLAFGAPYREMHQMHTHYVRSRKTCEYRLIGGPMTHGFPGYLCISPAYYASHPEQDVVVQLTGQRSALGMQVEQVHAVD